MSSLKKLVIENIVESINVGLMVISNTGEIVFLNKAVCKILDLNLAEHLGRGWGELFIKSEYSNIEFNQVIIDLIDEQKIGLTHRVSYYPESGNCPKELSITSSFLSNNSKILGMVFLFEDVTDSYQAEERERKILSRNVELQKERIAGLDALAQAVAHQVRNPTSIIGGLANIVSRKLPEKDPLQREMQAISEEAMKLEELVNVVKKYSTIPQPILSEIQVGYFFEKAIERANRILAKIGENTVVNIESNISELNIDSSLFTSVIVELLLNASNFTPSPSTKVDIKVFLENDVLRIKVIDHGFGIEKKSLPYVCDPFFSTKAKGVGMGLSLVKKIVFEHQGKLFIESDGLNMGTTVTIELLCSDGICCYKNNMF
ncbi:MAG: PAS domain-containing sensor histidine kinase [Desulfovibrio sp. S3730MH75]|nr:MAG: PAS domain-containing sensor histidine kinase [Desulfovibrio sp. S3730MH75]